MSSQCAPIHHGHGLEVKSVPRTRGNEPQPLVAFKLIDLHAHRSGKEEEEPDLPTTQMFRCEGASYGYPYLSHEDSSSHGFLHVQAAGGATDVLWPWRLVRKAVFVMIT